MAQQSTCDADNMSMLDAYIYDYLVKKNLQVTANSFLTEGKFQAVSVAIDAPEGFLLEWWSFFWDFYFSRTNETPSETASAYTNVRLQRSDPNNSLLGGSLNEFDFEAMTGQSTASSMTGITFEELMRHPNEMDCESLRTLLSGRPTNLNSATNHSGQLVQGNSGSLTAGQQQIQAQSQQNPDVSQSLLAADPSSFYGPGIMQSNPGIANEGLDSGVGGHPLERCASTVQELLLQNATQFQLLPRQLQQQLLAQLPELEGDLGISPTYSDMEAQIFCTWPINSLNAKDHHSITNDGSLVSPMQSTPLNINTPQISQSSCPQQSNRNRKWTAASGVANRAGRAGTGNIAGDSPNSPQSTSSPHITGTDDRVAIAADGAGALLSSAHQLPDDDYRNDLFGPLTRNPSEPAAENSKVLSFNEIGCINTNKRKIVCCHFSSDGKVLASAGIEKVLLWNMETGQTEINSKDHSRLISDVRFRPNWTQLLTSSHDTTVRLWDAAQPNSCLQTYTGPDSAAKSIDFHPTKNELFCSCYANNEIHFWNINQNSATHFFKGGSSQVRFQPRIGHLLASTSRKYFKIFDVETQRRVPLISEAQGHSSLVKTVCWDNNGDCLASLSRDCIKIWSLTSGDLIHELTSSGKHFRSCVFHPTHSSLLVIGCFQSIWLWNMAQNKYMEFHAHKDLVNCVVQSPVTGMIASAGLDFSVKIWR